MKEITAIRRKFNAADFYSAQGSHYVLKTQPDGYCQFFDSDSKQCRIYDCRPLDCKLFPFVPFARNGSPPVWILWDCPFSSALSRQNIQTFLNHFESVYDKDLPYLWNYDPTGYDLDHYDPSKPGMYRILRNIKTFPPTGL